ncbi:hypothetical protein MKX03_019872 [Papaver bracteatum]|nr:hypothetical protein MKX03_019872 [Papaver bracteatum]
MQNREEENPTVGELDFTRTKSRFAETSYPLLTRSPIIHKISAPDDEEEEEAWNTEHEEDRKKYIKKKKKVGWIGPTITTGFMYCLTVDSFKNQTKWGLEIWNWCLLVMCLFLVECFLAWFPNVQKNNEIFKKVFRTLIGVLVGVIIWLTKIVFVKVLASSFHVVTFFDRMMFSTGLHGYWYDIERLRKLSRENTASAWSIPRLVNYVMYSGLSTISRTLDNCGSSEITSESEARITAQRVFKHVAQPDAKYILEEDLLRFLRREDIDTILPFFECTAGHTRLGDVQAYTERKALAHSLNDTATAVQQLHKLASAVVSMLIDVVFVLVMGLATSKVILVIKSQLLLVGFMFQNTCKTIFEAIIFVFVMHPFDVGDRCKIDGVMMTVEEMNIFTTVFLKMTRKSNFYRSPDMLDYVDFAMDSSTSMDTPKYWAPKQALYVKQNSTMDKLDMCLLRQLRRTELIYELKKIFEIETLQIKYQLLPQQVHLTQFSIVHRGSTSQP